MMITNTSDSLEHPQLPLASRRVVLGLVLAMMTAYTALACERKPDSAATTPQAERPSASVDQEASSARAESEALTVVSDRNLVCMVNNQFMGKPQIPVSVEGKTYYGCCPMCKERLAKNADIRSAIDPVSQKAVDKAEAVMAKTATGDILYFENNANVLAYSKRAGP